MLRIQTSSFVLWLTLSASSAMVGGLVGCSGGSGNTGGHAGSSESGTGGRPVGGPGGGSTGGSTGGSAATGGAGGASDPGGRGGGAGIGAPADPAVEAGDGIMRETIALGASTVDRYTWLDARGRPRTASLKRQGATNGGYAIQLTYQVPDGAGWRTVTADGQGGGEAGFGYFVAHERYRTFDDGTFDTIASLHGEDDSPLGSGFPVSGSHAPITAVTTSVSHTFVTSYPKWGTTVAQSDVDATTPKASSAHHKFVLPLQIRWTFQKGTDFPRLDFALDLGAATAGQLAFDVRGPYGVLELADGDGTAALNNVQWGDSAFHFTTRAAAAGNLTTVVDWVWSEAIGTTRPYHALLARQAATGVLYEIGLVEMKLGADPGLVYGGYSDNRGTTKAASGHALLSADFPEGDWPFQSAQYSGLSAAAPTLGKKFAWGSSSLYGSRNPSQYLNAKTSVPVTGFPPSGTLVYRTCLVLGVSPFTDASPIGLTRSVTQSAEPSCATDHAAD